ncbi:hypothetical protein BH11PSE12_BH11PSE12_20580 [soil metagenome]
MQPRYQMHIYFDGTAYVANVPELVGCAGYGQNYIAAVINAEAAITEWVFNAINSGMIPPEPANDFVLHPPTRPVGKGMAAPVMLRLHRKYGNLSNREISKAIGLVEQYAVTPSAFANAAAGKGARFVRCVIAIALGELPSALWTFPSEKTRQADDELYLSSIVDDEKPSLIA